MTKPAPAHDAQPRIPEIPTADRGFAEGFFYGFWAYLSRLAASTLFDLRVYHADRVPESGAAIIAPNHVSTLDPWVVGSTLRRRPCYLGRSTLFDFPGFGWFLRHVGTLPVPRESQAPRAALEICLRILERGRLLVLFPEGTRSQDGRVQPLKKGTAWIARRSGAPVVPVRVVGSFEAWPRSGASIETGLLPKRFPIRVIYGKPLEYQSGESSDAFLDRLRQNIELLGLEECGHECPGPSWHWSAARR